jgi:TolB-like protein
MPRHLWAHVLVAIAAGELGRQAEATSAVASVMSVAPDLASPDALCDAVARWKWNAAAVETHIEGYRKAVALYDRTGRSTSPPRAGTSAPPALSRSDAPRPGSPTASARTGTPPPTIGSIAVLPFTDLSPAGDQGWFCDGVAEEIINTLARVPELKVIARTSAFAFKGQHLPIPQIAEALGVRTVLEGSVRRADRRIRVTAQLVQAADGAQLWSERYDRDPADVFAVQDDIAASITRALRGQLAPAVDLPHVYGPRSRPTKRI